MKKRVIIGTIIILLILLVAALKYLPGVSSAVWNLSGGGVWLLPLVLISALLDSVHPCSFSILLITIAFLFSVQLGRKRILSIGGLYIAGIFSAYFLIGLGLLKVLHLFNTPHFMGRLGAAMLIAFGLINLLNRFFPRFPIKLKIPDIAHAGMAKLLERTSFIAAFGLGLLVGICQFPCMGGPYLMVIGLLKDQATYVQGFGYLLLYNLILIVPLVAVLLIAADKFLIEKVQLWKKTNMSEVRLWAGIAMIAIGLLVLMM